MMPPLDFTTLPLPAIHFGDGRFSMLAELARSFGKSVLLVTGGHTLQNSGRLSALEDALGERGVKVFHQVAEGEPSPELVDLAVSRWKGEGISSVVAAGGGSAIDAGKAISAMMPQSLPAERFIEGRPGFLPHDGRKLPFIAVPTTSGTGSEVTNNAVISRVGPEGFKRSLRHPSFVPDIAVIDPELMITASRELTASSGMDACTQLIEALTSPLATPYTDAVAKSGLERFSRSFIAVCSGRGDESALRGDIAYGALMSGIALSNAGLGIVHGFASSVGGLFDIPHGVLCATLLLEATRENINCLQHLDPKHPMLDRYAIAGRILSGSAESDIADGCSRLLETLEEWQELLGFPRLRKFGIVPEDFERIAALTRSKTNAVDLDHNSMQRILSSRW